MMDSFICSKCGNSDPKYIGYLNGRPYCRLCISFKGEEAPSFHFSGGRPTLRLNYSLSPEQEKISARIIENFKNKKDTLINAVCGAGKTELVYGVIHFALMNKLSIGFAIPRRDVVTELFYRIRDAFPGCKVTAVYGGHTSKLTGDIVVLTTHQLYRYPTYFDLIVLDEIDAFPFNGSVVLNQMLKRSLKGNMVLMSATPSKEILDLYHQGKREVIELNTRFHHHPLPVPKIVIKYGLFRIVYLIKIVKSFVLQKKPVFIFAPTIEIADELFAIVRLFINGGNVVHSKRDGRADIINDFRKGKYVFLITTAVLERGVTIKNLQVVIYKSDHNLYNEYSLVQIAGRVGRKSDAPNGEVIFLASKKTISMEKAKDTIIAKNRYL